MKEPVANNRSWAEKLGKAVNGKPLEGASWLTSVITVPPGYHRLKNAVGLSIGLYTGRKLMNIVVGAKPDGTEIRREDVPLPLRPLHGIMKYNHFSDDPRDRWMKAVDNVAPAVLGAFGAVAGSHHFFKQRGEALKNPQYMDEFDESMSMEQSKPWSLLSGITSLFGSASGAALGPVGNYGASLGTRFALASGRKVALPGLGKIISGNHSNMPFGPTQMIDRMIDYVTENPSARPERLERMAHGILAPLFKGVKPEQVQDFVGKVHGIRDQFLAEGGIPEEAHGKVRDLLKSHFRGAGLESTLQEIGIDPLTADLGNNGLSRSLAKWMGKSSKLTEMGKDFAEKYAARQSRSDGVERG